MSKPSMKEANSDTDSRKVFKSIGDRGNVDDGFWRPNRIVTSLRC